MKKKEHLQHREGLKATPVLSNRDADRLLNRVHMGSPGGMRLFGQVKVLVVGKRGVVERFEKASLPSRLYLERMCRI